MTNDSFLFRGTSHLVDHLFVHSARSLKLVNPAGVRKIRRNMLALQQSLRSIHHSSSDGVLRISHQYWEMYERMLIGQDILEELRTTAKPPFSFEDYNTMLNLICKTDVSGTSSSELNTHLIDLHALAMSIDGWEA
jgi:exocyst complex component 4